MRENEDAAEAAGVDALGTKLRAMAISSFLTALGGTFYAQYFAYIDPAITFGPASRSRASCRRSWAARAPCSGPLLGAFVLTPMSELTRAVLRGRAGADVMLYGLDPDPRDLVPAERAHGLARRAAARAAAGRAS